MNILDTPLPPYKLFLRSSNYTSNLDADDSKNNLIFELNNPLLCDATMDILVSCDSFQFTNSLYMINEYNRYFYYNIQGSSAVGGLILALGNYNIDTLITELNELAVNNFTFTYNPSTYKITITHKQGLLFKLVDKDLKYNNIYENLGFDDYGTNSYASSFTSPYLYNLISTQVLHICANNINLDNLYLRNTKRYNILASIHITSIFGDTQTYFNNTGFKYKINDPTLTFLNLEILDQDMNPVDFNNIDWFCNLCFQYIYKKDLKLNSTLEQYNQSNEDINQTMEEIIRENQQEEVMNDLENELE